MREYAHIALDQLRAMLPDLAASLDALLDEAFGRLQGTIGPIGAAQTITRVDHPIEHEEEIVRNYHEKLLAEGVEGFGWQDCWQAYRKSAFAGFGVTVIAAMIVQQTERGDQMFLTMADRHSRHALDLGSEEFLV